jgi:hypothetical protein
LLNDLCGALLVPEKVQFKPPGHYDRLTFLMFHDLGGPMILEAAQGGLPHDKAIIVGHSSCSSTITKRRCNCWGIGMRLWDFLSKAD